MPESAVITPVLEREPEDLLQQALQNGNPIESAWRAGQVKEVTDVALPQHRTAWPKGATYTVASASKVPEISALDAHDPDFYGAEASVYAQEAIGARPSLTQDRLREMRDDPMNSPVSRGEARVMLEGYGLHKNRFQAQIAAERVGWAASVDGHFVACPPSGNVLLGHATDSLALSTFLRDNGYGSLPLDNPYAQPMVEALARRSGVSADQIRARGLAKQQEIAAKQAAQTPLDATRVERLDATRIDLEPVSAAPEHRDATELLPEAGEQDAYPVMTSFAFAAAVGRLVNDGLFPQARSAVELTRSVMMAGDLREGLPEYTSAQREALTGALVEIARRPAVNPAGEVLRQEAKDALSVLSSLAIRDSE